MSQRGSTLTMSEPVLVETAITTLLPSGANQGAKVIPGTSPSTRCCPEMMRGPLLVDSQGRVMRDLRVSVTDRCNFRCMYCLPETEAAENFYRDRWATVVNPVPITRAWQPKQNILTFEEMCCLA